MLLVFGLAYTSRSDARQTRSAISLKTPILLCLCGTHIIPAMAQIARDICIVLAPRLFMVERGHDDGVSVDQWVSYEYAFVRQFYDQLILGPQTQIEFFNGPTPGALESSGTEPGIIRAEQAPQKGSQGFSPRQLPVRCPLFFRSLLSRPKQAPQKGSQGFSPRQLPASLPPVFPQPPQPAQTGPKSKVWASAPASPSPAVLQFPQPVHLLLNVNISIIHLHERHPPFVPTHCLAHEIFFSCAVRKHHGKSGTSAIQTQPTNGRRLTSFVLRESVAGSSPGEVAAITSDPGAFVV